MKHLQIFNLSLLLLAATFAIVLGVVCILYLAQLDAAPLVRRELPRLLAITALFTALGAYAALVWWAQHAQKPWAWWPQLALAPVLVASFFAFQNITGLQ